MAGPRPLGIATDFFKYFAFKDPNCDYKTRLANFDSDIELANRPENLPVDDAYNFDSMGLIVAWQENGQTPSQLVATHFKDGKDAGTRLRLQVSGGRNLQGKRQS